VQKADGHPLPIPFAASPAFVAVSSMLVSIAVSIFKIQTPALLVRRAGVQDSDFWWVLAGLESI
jgi:hypothetical protein